MNKIKAVILLILSPIVIGFIVPVIIWILTSNLVMKSDYTAEIVVDKSEKIPVALSNAMHRVTSKGFIINNISINHNANQGKYTIKCGGIEEATLLKYD